MTLDLDQTTLKQSEKIHTEEQAARIGMKVINHDAARRHMRIYWMNVFTSLLFFIGLSVAAMAFAVHQTHAAELLTTCIANHGNTTIAKMSDVCASTYNYIR